MSSVSLPSQLRTAAVNTLLHTWYGTVPAKSDYQNTFLGHAEINEEIRKKILSGEPCMVSRLGGVEGGMLAFDLRWRRKGLTKPPFPKKLLAVLRTHVGVFPITPATLDYFFARYLDALPEADLIGCSLHRGEHSVYNHYCKEASCFPISSMIPLMHQNPWTSALKGKQVLVIHPFVESIKKQYRDNREKIFCNPEMLPEFELQVIPAVQSLADATGGFASWESALKYMETQIAEADFDIAIIGAGAYGLPLSATVKKMGKQAIHLGGATQLLFGIKGRRWETEFSDTIAPLMNAHWVRPQAEEIPPGAKQVEDGCYW